MTANGFERKLAKRKKYVNVEKQAM